MAGIRLRLCEEDRERFERGDEWFPFDIDALFDETPVGVQEALEDGMDYALRQMNGGLAVQGTKAMRARLWVARYLAGVREPFDEFSPAVHKIEVDLVEEPAGDAAPPDEAPQD